jgi:hypothetical protein
MKICGAEKVQLYHCVEVPGQLRDSGALPAGVQPPTPIGPEAGWTTEPVWTLRKREKSLVPAGIRIPLVQPVRANM